jgi:glycolate oxidase FAD binding subunit
MTILSTTARLDETRNDADVIAVLRDAIAGADPVRVMGRGTWLTMGTAVPAARTLSLARDSGVVAYTPGDLVITVRAGTTFTEIDAVLNEYHQWLPMDPDGGRDVTIGATAATGSYGPLAEIYGTPRDQILGMTVVTGRGDIIRVGGQVVKNVAGFDLTRLMIGAWGTLGVITQVTLRVRARGGAKASLEHMRRAMPSQYGCREPIVTVPSLSKAIKHTFDPHDILNRGLMGDSA